MPEALRVVNALKIRNHLGEVLDLLEEERGPILVSKGRKIRAVLITPEDFRTRFVDRRAEAELQARLAEVDRAAFSGINAETLGEALRSLRGELR